MKLLKKLLPVTALASVVAVATPLATSCSKGITVTASDFEYKPSIEKHSSDTISFNDETKMKELTKDYFSNPKHFGEDFCDTKVKCYSELKSQLGDKYKDVSVTFSVTVKNMNFSEQKEVTINLPGSETSKKVTGYIVSYELAYSRYFTYSLENPEKAYKKYKYTLETQETDSVKNAFAFIYGKLDGQATPQPTEVPTIFACFNDGASEDWEWRDAETYSETQEWTYTDGNVIVDQDNGSASDYYSKKVVDTPDYRINLLRDVQAYFRYEDELLPTGSAIADNGSQYLSQIKLTY